MNKTVTANISGVVFHIEVDAYEKLNRYLSTIKTYFRDSEGKDEIMADIEARIAELFKEDMEPGKEVITVINVEKVISIMGEPEQYMEEASDTSYNEENQQTGSDFRSRKLYRDPDDNMIGGVCSGLSYYFGIDKIWFRAAFLIALIAGAGTGVIIYIILWIIVPSPKTTAEKLEMKGEPINVENIGNTIKDEFNGFKKKVKSKDTKGYVQKAENSIYKFFDFLLKVLVYFFKFIFKLVGVALVIASLFALASILTIVFGGPVNFSLSNANIDGNWFTDFASIVFNSSSLFYLGYIGLLLVVLIPILGLLYGGLKLLFKIPSSNRAVSISATSLWILGLIMVSIAAVSTISEFSNEQKITESITLDQLPSDTLILSSLQNSYSGNRIGSVEINIEGDQMLLNSISIDVVRSNDQDTKMKLVKSANGSNRKEAGERAEKIVMEYSMDGNNIEVNPFIAVPLKDKYRSQEIEASITLPVGKTIFLTPSSRDLIYDIKNVSNTYDGKMIGHHWKMTTKGLVCTDCDWIKSSMQEVEVEEVKQVEFEETSDEKE
ncbi:MAG: PspC domain-containing protein [Vicingaceae bacterium]